MLYVDYLFARQMLCPLWDPIVLYVDYLFARAFRKVITTELSLFCRLCLSMHAVVVSCLNTACK